MLVPSSVAPAGLIERTASRRNRLIERRRGDRGRDNSRTDHADQVVRSAPDEPRQRRLRGLQPRGRLAPAGEIGRLHAGTPVETATIATPRPATRTFPPAFLGPGHRHRQAGDRRRAEQRGQRPDRPGRPARPPRNPPASARPSRGRRRPRNQGSEARTIKHNHAGSASLIRVLLAVSRRPSRPKAGRSEARFGPIRAIVNRIERSRGNYRVFLARRIIDECPRRNRLYKRAGPVASTPRPVDRTPRPGLLSSVSSHSYSRSPSGPGPRLRAVPSCRESGLVPSLSTRIYLS